MRIDTGELYFADCRQDVIIIQTDISGISRNTPFIMSVNSYILFKEFFQSSALGNLKFPDTFFTLSCNSIIWLSALTLNEWFS